MVNDATTKMKTKTQPQSKNFKRISTHTTNKIKYGNNPRRGGPGILVTCERGREFKARREADEILMHYYRRHRHNDLEGKKGYKRTRNSIAVTSIDDDGKQEEHKYKLQESPITDGGRKRKRMTLDEEISEVVGEQSNEVNASTRNGHGKKRIFTEYKTDGSGTIFLMYTGGEGSKMPVNGEYKNVSPTKESPKSNIETTSVPPSVSTNSEVTETKLKDNEPCETTSLATQDEAGSTSNSATTTNTTTTPEKVEAPVVPLLKLTAARYILQCLTDSVGGGCDGWDPIETTRTIFEDLRHRQDKNGGESVSSVPNNNETTTDGKYLYNDGEGPPGSRFVLRMIPIQVTCFAEPGEIEGTAELLIDHMFPSPLLSKDSVTTKEGGDEQKEQPQQSQSQPQKTFAIKFKKRNCSNVTREDVISRVASVISKKTSLKVNLTKPDYTFYIEICQTLCGMSMIKANEGIDSFNVSELRQPQKKEA